MLIDLSAAFYMVDHNILLEKLELYGMDAQARNWMGSYLANRTQVVMVDGCLSPPPNVTCGGHIIQPSRTEIPLAPMGVLAPGSAHARPSAQPPIDTSRNFSAHMGGEIV